MARLYSVFRAELEAHLSVGKPYYVAKQDAIDYYRQFTKREQTSIWDWEDQYVDRYIAQNGTPDSLVMGESNYLEANLTPESRTLFNDLARELFFRFVRESNFPDFAKKYVCWIFRKSNLEHILDDDLQVIVQEVMQGSNPSELFELSKFIGFPVNKGNRISFNFEWHLQKVETELKIFTKTML